MIGWLREARAVARRTVAVPTPPPTIEVAGRTLPIELRPMAQARRLTMRLAPDGSAVRISLPHGLAPAAALRFALERRDWLAAQLAQVRPPVTLATGSVLPFRGSDVTLVWRPDAPRTPAITGTSLIVGGAPASLETRVLRWLRHEATTLFAADLARFCARAGRPVPRFGLSNARRRWGSCAADGTIRLNWRLIGAPDMVREAVVAHEVAHLAHFNHSPAFHAECARLLGGSPDAANAWLKAHGRTLLRLDPKGA